MSESARKAARMHQTYNEAASLAASGYINDDVWRWYVFFWSWTAVRFAGVIGRHQDRVFETHFRLKDGTAIDGNVFLYRRFARVNAMRKRLASKESQS